MRYLFVKKSLAWPRSSGHDVHSYYMMRALTQLGHEVSLATVTEPTPASIEGLPLRSLHVLSTDQRGSSKGLRFTWLQERFRSYWGVDPGLIRAVGRAVEDCAAEVIVVVGLDVLPYLGAVEGAKRVWYAGDEWVWHHLSQVRVTQSSTWENLRDAAVKGIYEWSYGNLIDRAWVVSETDLRAMNRMIGSTKVNLVPNGVDGDHYRPTPGLEVPRSCVFWGRLDFGPNIQAIEWFCRRVWPAIRRLTPDARFTIYGFKPTGRIAALATRDGVSLVPDLPDIRAEIARHQVVILPFVSGGGIKNKFLEAASMGRTILCSPLASKGLVTGDLVPFLTAKTAQAWTKSLTSLWDDPERRRRLGEDARGWVLEHHSWEAAALNAASSLGRA